MQTIIMQYPTTLWPHAHTVIRLDFITQSVLRILKALPSPLIRPNNPCPCPPYHSIYLLLRSQKPHPPLQQETPGYSPRNRHFSIAHLCLTFHSTRVDILLSQSSLFMISPNGIRLRLTRFLRFLFQLPTQA